MATATIEPTDEMLQDMQVVAVLDEWPEADRDRAIELAKAALDGNTIARYECGLLMVQYGTPGVGKSSARKDG